MRLSLCSITGLGAAFATMAFVAALAIFAQAKTSPATASVCPSKMKSDMQTHQPSGA